MSRFAPAYAPVLVAFACGISAARAETPAVKPDAFGDPLPAGAAVRIGSVRLRHEGGVFDAAFSRDEAALVSLGDDGVVRVWDAASGRERRQFPVPDRPVQARRPPGASATWSGESPLAG